MNNVYKDFIYLTYCSLNRVVPDKERISNTDLEKLFAVSRHQTLVSLTAFALETADIYNSRFDDAKEKAIRKNLFLDTERKKLFAFCENKGIWYMPLKGSILKDIYPEYGMRQMADNDILYDITYREDVRKYFESLGYEVFLYGKKNHDIYMKPPVLNFEMHYDLFGEYINSVWADYYSDIKNRLIKDQDNQYGYHFSDDDFYIYITTHEYKHFSRNGTGLRSLADRYVFIKNKDLDLNYIEAECQKLGIAEYEKESRELSLKLFEHEPDLDKFTDAELKMLNCYLDSGTYGSVENKVAKSLKNQSKLSFWIQNIFIPWKLMKYSVPFTAASPLLYPIGVIWRCCRVLIKNRGLLRQTVKAVKKY
ncbi:MAG: nucleotidyltransferase family protein [Ruminococcus sp.]|nr:nucleotidyltransferase family protein [Ruminococcus sp.]